MAVTSWWRLEGWHPHLGVWDLQVSERGKPSPDWTRGYKGGQDEWGTGASLLRGKAEGAGLV